MNRQTRVTIVSLLAAGGLLAVFAIAYAAIWTLGSSAEADLINEEFVWDGSVEATEVNDNFVCVVFEPDDIAPLLCSGNIGDVGDSASYSCALPFQTLNDFGAPVQWSLVVAPNDNCTGHGAQDEGDSGQISPTAVSLSAFSAQQSSPTIAPFALAAALGAVVLLASAVVYQRRNRVRA